MVSSCTCCAPVDEQVDDEVKTFDDFRIEKFNTPKKISSSSRNDSNSRLSIPRKNSIQYTEKEKTWKNLSDDYLQVVVLTNASLWSFAPQGLSKNGHLANGSMDLILITPVTRKEFLRYVKRNGNSKDQV
mgnify:CR=1 FL=1